MQIRLLAGVNYFRHKEYLTNFNGRDVALIFLGEEHRIHLPKVLQNITTVNSMCLVTNPPYGYKDDGIVGIGGFGRKNLTHSDKRLITKMEATIAYSQSGQTFQIDSTLNFAYINRQPPWPKACGVSRTQKFTQHLFKIS